jgi:hypothetical protein
VSFAVLLLDGFDEIAAAGWAGKTMLDEYFAYTVAADLIQVLLELGESCGDDQVYIREVIARVIFLGTDLSSAIMTPSKNSQLRRMPS